MLVYRRDLPIGLNRTLLPSPLDNWSRGSKESGLDAKNPYLVAKGPANAKVLRRFCLFQLLGRPSSDATGWGVASAMSAINHVPARDAIWWGAFITVNHAELHLGEWKTMWDFGKEGIRKTIALPKFPACSNIFQHVWCLGRSEKRSQDFGLQTLQTLALPTLPRSVAFVGLVARYPFRRNTSPKGSWMTVLGLQVRDHQRKSMSWMTNILDYCSFLGPPLGSN